MLLGIPEILLSSFLCRFLPLKPTWIMEIMNLILRDLVKMIQRFHQFKQRGSRKKKPGVYAWFFLSGIIEIMTV